MSRKRLAALAALAAGALVAAGIAVAAHQQTTQAAAADFAATTATKLHSHTCTGSDGTYQDTDGWYTGNATNASDPRLAGTLTIHAHSVLNTTTGLGWLNGDYRVKNANGNTRGTIRAALAGGNAVGALTGHAGRPESRLVASFWAGFTQNTGFSNGKLGSGSFSGAGTIFSRGACPAPPPKKPHPFLVAVFHLDLTSREAVPPTKLNAHGGGTLTLDLTRDSNGVITAANAVFDVDYAFAGSVNVTDIALYLGARGTNGAKALDSGIAPFTDADGHGNATHTVSGISASLAQALLANARGYYVQLDSSLGTLRDQLGGPAHH
jgi:hypothetical protein